MVDLLKIAWIAGGLLSPFFLLWALDNPKNISKGDVLLVLVVWVIIAVVLPAGPIGGLQ
jgi:hypothetical protein